MPNTLPNKRFFSVKEIAKILGLSTNTVYKYLDDGGIKSVRFGKEGRFRVPKEEVVRLIQETGLQIQFDATPTKTISNDFKIAGAPSLFDWFVGFLSIGLGFSQFIFPDYNLASSFTSYVLYVRVLQTLLMVIGLWLISYDILGLKKAAWHTLTHVLLGVIYFVLTYLFIVLGTIPTAVGYISIATVIILTAFKKFGEYARFLIFANILYFLTGITFLVYSQSFLLGSVFMSTPTRLLIFIGLWIIGLILSLFFSFRSVKKGGGYMKAMAFGISIVAFIYATFAFANGFWGRSIYCLILGSFSVIFPFSSHFQAFTLKSKKELIGSFAWLFGIFFIGSVFLYFIYSSFQRYILAELKNRIETASQITSSFMNSNVANITAASESDEFVGLMKGTDKEDIESHLKGVYLASGGNLRRVVLINHEGIIISSYPYLMTSQGVDISNRDYFIGAKNQPGTNITGIVQPTTQGVPPAVLISAPISDEEGNFLGVLMGSADLTELARLVNYVKFGINGKIIMTDSGKNYIIPPTPDKILTKAEEGSQISLALSGKDEAVQGYNESGVLSFLAYKKVDKLNWGIVAEQPLSEAFSAYSITGFIIYLGFVISGLGGLVFIIYTRRNKNEREL